MSSTESAVNASKKGSAEEGGFLRWYIPQLIRPRTRVREQRATSHWGAEKSEPPERVGTPLRVLRFPISRAHPAKPRGIAGKDRAVSESLQQSHGDKD